MLAILVDLAAHTRASAPPQLPESLALAPLVLETWFRILDSAFIRYFEAFSAHRKTPFMMNSGFFTAAYKGS